MLVKIVGRLVEAYRPERVYLFGSWARGDAGPDSDYDLLLVVPDSADTTRRRSRLAYEVLWETGRAADVVVLTRTDFESRLHLAASLPAIVAREGRLPLCRMIASPQRDLGPEVVTLLCPATPPNRHPLPEQH